MNKGNGNNHEITVSVGLRGCLPVSESYPYKALRGDVADVVMEEMELSYDASPGDTPNQNERDIQEAIKDATETLQDGSWSIELADGMILTIDL